MLGLEPALDAAGVTAFDMAAKFQLYSMFVECVLQLRHGRISAKPDEEEAQ